MAAPELRTAGTLASEDDAPDWFHRNVGAPHTSNYLDVKGAKVHYLHWRARPAKTDGGQRAGLILIHGNGAHAHWWSFLAPFFRDYDVVALSLSGSGQSGWRTEYSFGLWADECWEVGRAAGFLDQGATRAKPIVLAHSMGVSVAMAMARRYGGALGGLLLLDELPRPAGYFDGLPTTPWVERGEAGLRLEPRAHKVRPWEESPRVRLRLAPPQKEMNRFILNFIADHSVREAAGGGWTWAFDPDNMAKIAPAERFPHSLAHFLSVESVRALPVKTTFIVGERSLICTLIELLLRPSLA